MSKMNPKPAENNQSPDCQRIFAKPSRLPRWRRLSGRISRPSRAETYELDRLSQKPEIHRRRIEKACAMLAAGMRHP